MQNQALMQGILILALLALPVEAGAHTTTPCPNSTPCAGPCPVQAAPPPVQPVTNLTIHSISHCASRACYSGYDPMRDYSGQDFSEQYLPLSDFRHNQLSSTCFYEATLMESDFRGASLLGADLRKTAMMGANLRHANLGNAHLEGANLRGAQLRHANLIGATYDVNSRFPIGFVPGHWGMVEVCYP